MTLIKLFKEGQEPLTVHSVEVPGYVKNGWSETKPKPAKPTKKEAKYCRFKKKDIKYIDYKDADFLMYLVNEQGKICLLYTSPSPRDS